MSTEQTSIDAFGHVTEFERLTGVRGTTYQQEDDTDRVADAEPLELADGLGDALDGDVEVSYD